MFLAFSESLCSYCNIRRNPPDACIAKPSWITWYLSTFKDPGFIMEIKQRKEGLQLQ
jgi:hypothetical protein